MNCYLELIWRTFFKVPDSYQFWELLSQETESTECQNELSDFVNHVADKETQLDQNKVTDFNSKRKEIK